MEELDRKRLPYINSQLFAMYLNKAFERLYRMRAKEFAVLKKTKDPRLEDMKVNVYFDEDRIIIGKGKVQVLRPPGVPAELWKAFVAYLIQKHGVDDIEETIIESLTEMIREKVITYLRIFNFDVPIAKFDPSKLDRELLERLPKDLREYLIGLASTSDSEKD